MNSLVLSFAKHLVFLYDQTQTRLRCTLVYIFHPRYPMPDFPSPLDGDIILLGKPEKP